VTREESHCQFIKVVNFVFHQSTERALNHTYIVKIKHCRSTQTTKVKSSSFTEVQTPTVSLILLKIWFLNWARQSIPGKYFNQKFRNFPLEIFFKKWTTNAKEL